MGENGRVMVVDDEEDLLAITEMFLHECGLKDVDTFSNPFDALSNFKEKNGISTSQNNDSGYCHYSLVLTDIRMPGMNGFELAMELQKIDPRIKIMLMSAFDLDKETSKILPVIKCQDLLQKPFLLGKFCEEVRKKLMTS
jgi:two-component system, cell cycle response regulator CpdR